MEKKNLTIQELYDYCRDNDALDFIISIPYEKFDADTDFSYAVSSSDYSMTLSVDLNKEDKVVDIAAF